jgi:hypothetical protein
MARFEKLAPAALAAATALAAIGGVAQDAHAVPAYQFNDVGNRARSQFGFAYAYIGDDATRIAAAPGTAYRLDTIAARFALVDYGSTADPSRVDSTANPFNPYDSEGITAYTPNLQLVVFEIDPTTRLPVSNTPLGTATVNNQTFQPANVQFDEPNFDPQLYTDADVQTVTFDFTGQNIILPEHFGFAYRDLQGTSADGNVTDERNFFGSIFTTEQNSDPVAVGSTEYGTLVSYQPQEFNDFAFGDPAAPFNQPGVDWPANSNWPAVVNATLVPEPTGLGLLALGGLALLRRRKAPKA